MNECIYYYYATVSSGRVMWGCITGKKIKKNSDFHDIVTGIKEEIMRAENISLDNFTLESFSLVGHHD